MTDTSSTAPDTTGTDSQDASTTETDWKAEARKWEERAKENGKTARQNQDAARRLAELEDAQKTELQKAAERAEAAERRAAELEQAQQLTALRTEVSSESGVPAAILAGPADTSRESLAAFAELVKGYVGEQSPTRFPVVNNPAGTPTTTANDERNFAHALFGG